MEQVFTVDEAAEHLKVRPETVRRLLSQGRLPGNKVGRAWRIPEGALMDYLRGDESGAPLMLEGTHGMAAAHSPMWIE